MKKPRLDLSDAAGAGGAPAGAPAGLAGATGVNPFTGRAYSDRYHSILAKRVNLPVYVQRDDFIQMLHTHQTIVLVGETGSGKTTQVRARGQCAMRHCRRIGLSPLRACTAAHAAHGRECTACVTDACVACALSPSRYPTPTDPPVCCGGWLHCQQAAGGVHPASPCGRHVCGQACG